MSANAIAVWDFTLKSDGVDREDLCKCLSTFCKKWAFQLERGESGYEHYQGRVSLKVRSRSPVKYFHQGGFDKVHLSPTTNLCRGNELYVLKEDTRIDGPWFDTASDSNSEYVPRDILRINEIGWRPFQEDIWKECLVYDEDRVNIIVHPQGMAGKSKTARRCCVYGRAEIIPSVNSFNDLMRIVCDIQITYFRKHRKYCNAFFMDMPRAVSKERLYQLYGAIETIKSGFAYDERYSWKRIFFDPPRIFIFTNEYPDVTLLSKGRWNIQGITQDYNLVPYDQILSDAEEGVEIEYFDDLSEPFEDLDHAETRS